MQHFIKFVKPSKENRILLILDHESHIGPEITDLARSKGIILLTLAPHTSNRMSPLDVAVFAPFKNYYAEEVQSGSETIRVNVLHLQHCCNSRQGISKSVFFCKY